MSQVVKIQGARTNSGKLGIWEHGGGSTNTGTAQIVCGDRGQPLKPIYIRARGDLSNSDHALFVAQKGMHIVKASHHRDDFEIDVLRIDSECDDFIFAEIVAQYRQGEWDNPYVMKLMDAIDAAKDKAQTYHCRTPVYFEVLL